MPTIAELAIQQQHTGSPNICAGCTDANTPADIQPCRVTYTDGSLAPEPIYYCLFCRDIIARGSPDFILTAEPIPAGVMLTPAEAVAVLAILRTFTPENDAERQLRDRLVDKIAAQHATRALAERIARPSAT